MNKTDIVFYLSTLAGASSLFAKVANTLVSQKTADWILAISIVISFVAFQFYEKLNGQAVIPSAPDSTKLPQ